MRIDYICIQKAVKQQLDILIPINVLEDISCFAEQISFSKGEIILGIGSGPQNIEENVQYMCSLMKSGKIKSIGVSNCNLNKSRQPKKLWMIMVTIWAVFKIITV